MRAIILWFYLHTTSTLFVCGGGSPSGSLKYLRLNCIKNKSLGTLQIIADNRNSNVYSSTRVGEENENFASPIPWTMKRCTGVCSWTSASDEGTSNFRYSYSASFKNAREMVPLRFVSLRNRRRRWIHCTETLKYHWRAWAVVVRLSSEPVSQCTDWCGFLEQQQQQQSSWINEQ